MKRYNLHKIAGMFGVAALLLTSCTGILDEQPRANMTPEFFETEEGITSGLTAVYSHLRWFYGPVGMMYLATCGTDEATYGDNRDGYGQDLDAYNITAGNSGLSSIWNNSFPFINTCNGIIDRGTLAGIAPSLLAEAHFFRAHDYFLLVTTFGGVPLDLGAGELKFNTSPVRVSQRNSVEDVYTKAIFPDLKQAISDLPSTPRATSAVAKVTAQHFLAKAYLTYGWWLERYGKTDPDGKSPSQYYQLAYDVAVEAIDNPGPFRLQNTFREVNLAANDRNSEILLCAEHTESSYTYDDSNPGSGGSEPYQQMKSNRSNMAMATDFELSVNGERFVYRRASQELGRPWRLLAPIHEVFTKTFPAADRTIDSRFDGTFVTVYRANYQSENNYNGTIRNGNNGIPIINGDIVFYFPSTDVDKPLLLANDVKSYYYYPDKAYAVWTPSQISRHSFPSVWKFGPDRADKTANGPFNDASTRPFSIAKLSETYLIAAEAAVKGATGTYSARDLVNVIRARAGMPDHSAAMTAATPANISIDYILAERSRELYAENLRWYDLTRTGKLEEYAGRYTICENRSDEAKVHIRDIKPHHYLRPIPANQFDNMDMSEADKTAYQNPGY